MKRFSLIFCVFLLIILTLVSCGKDIEDTADLPLDKEPSVSLDPNDFEEPSNEIAEPVASEGKNENIIPIADSDVPIAPEADNKQDDESVDNTPDEVVDTPETDEADIIENTEEVSVPIETTEVFTPLDITIRFNHELVKDVEERDILDLRTSVPYIQSGSCEGADEINMYFEGKAASFAEVIKSATPEEATDDTELSTAEMVCSITFNRNGFLSVILDSYSYSGVDESTVTRECAVFDVNTGKQLSIWDVVDNASTSKEALMTYISSEYSAEELNTAFDENMFALTENGVMLSFLPYSVNDSQINILSFTVRFDNCAMKIDLSVTENSELSESEDETGDENE